MGLTLATLGWAAALIAVVAIIGVVLIMRRRPAATNVTPLPAGEPCGCGDTQEVPALVVSPERVPLACTLMPDDFKERVARIERLAGRALLDAERRPLSLHLTYAPEAEQVRDLVRDEQACCAFLRFDLREDAHGVRVTIAAPEEARDAADVLFAHFMPHLARSRVPLPSTQRS